MLTCLVWAERSMPNNFWVPSQRFNSATGEQKGITQTIYTDSEAHSRLPNSLMLSDKLRSTILLREINDAQSIVLEAQDEATQKREGATATSTAMGPLCFPTLSERERSLLSQTFPPLGGGLSVLNTPRASRLPGLGRGTTEYFSGPVLAPSGSTLFPSPQVGSGSAMSFHQALTWGRPA